MVNLVTMDYFRTLWGNWPPQVDRDFSMIRLERVPREKVIQVIREIEGVDNDGWVLMPKFGIKTLGLEELSSGCKAVLCVLYYKELGLPGYVDLTECGKDALLACLALLDNSSVTGIMYTTVILDACEVHYTYSLNGRKVGSLVKLSIALKEALGPRYWEVASSDTEI